MDELIPFLIFVAFTIFEIFKKKRKGKKSPPIKKSAEKLSFNKVLTPADEILKDMFSFNEEVEEVGDFENEDLIIESTPISYSNETIESDLYEPISKEVEEVGKVEEVNIVSENLKHVNLAIKSAPSTLLSLKTLQLPTIPLIASNNNKSLRFPIKNKKIFKQSIIANIIFNSPRAYDSNFDNSNIH